MKLKKSIINQILDAYSTRPKEFVPAEGEGYHYRSKVIRDYHLFIETEKKQLLNADGTNIVSMSETGRIIVHHSDSRGKRVFNDIWAPDANGGYFWFCRNSAKEPFSDHQVIQDLEKTLKSLRDYVQELQKEHTETISLLTDQLELYKSLKNSQGIFETNSKKSGRPKETEKQLLQADKIKTLLCEGKSNEEIMQYLNLSRATFFRLKRMIKSGQ